MPNCYDCGSNYTPILWGHNGKYYCPKCEKKYVKMTEPDILKSALTCPFCHKVHEFDGPPDIEECECGATVDWRTDDFYKFEKWEE